MTSVTGWGDARHTGEALVAGVARKTRAANNGENNKTTSPIGSNRPCHRSKSDAMSPSERWNAKYPSVNS